MDKQALRKTLLQKRSDLSIAHRCAANQSIAQQVLEICQNVQHIGIYISVKEEVDTRWLINTFLANGKKVYVPKCQGTTLTFHQITHLDDCRPAQFGLLEPINEPASLRAIEMMLIPMVGYDACNNRIGYGKGYYDSILNQVDCLKIGLAYRAQKVEAIPMESHDIVMDKIITE